MILLLNTTVKISLIVLAALVASAMLRWRSAAVRHFVIAAALACAAATPGLRLVAPAWQTTTAWLPVSRMQLIDRPLAVLDDDSTQPAPAAGGSVAPPLFSRAAMAASFRIVWLAGVVVSLFVLGAGLARLSWLASRARRVTNGPWAETAGEISRAFGLRTTPQLLQSDHPSLLVTWGTWRARVLLPADAARWPSDRIRIVLAHELSHVRRGDWLVQIAADLLRSVYWFNPLVWLACKKLRLESERACDDAVLALGVDGSAYASELVTLARSFRSARQAFVPAAAIARPSSLERRVRAMLNAKLNRDPLTKSASIAAALVLAAVTVLVAGFGASAQSQFGTVQGTVTDQHGRTMAGVRMVLANPPQQIKHEVKTDESGHYEFVGVTPATYELTFDLAGFATLKREGLEIGSGQIATVNGVMKIGSIMETIRVVGPSDGQQPPPAPPRELSAVRANQKPDPCALSGQGGCVRPPRKIKDVRPIFPSGVDPGPSGTVVILSALIDVNGLVTNVEVLRSINQAFSTAAVDAVSAWEFLPTHLDGQPIETKMTVTVSFATK